MYGSSSRLDPGLSTGSGELLVDKRSMASGVAFARRSGATEERSMYSTGGKECSTKAPTVRDSKCEILCGPSCNGDSVWSFWFSEYVGSVSVPKDII